MYCRALPRAGECPRELRQCTIRSTKPRSSACSTPPMRQATSTPRTSAPKSSFEPRERAADIHLVLDTGPKYYFGELAIEQDILDPGLIGRFVVIEPGEPFDADRLIELQLALGDSGYFSNVTVDVMREQTVDRQIPVIVHTTPRQTQEYTLGMGYGTDTGPRLSLGTELRRLNRRGHRFHGDVRLSGIATTVAAEYQIPVKDVATDTLSYNALLGTKEIGDLETDQLSLGASWNDTWRGFQRRLYLVAHREDWTEGGNPSPKTCSFPACICALSKQPIRCSRARAIRGRRTFAAARKAWRHRRASCACMPRAPSCGRSGTGRAFCSTRNTARSRPTSFRGCRRRSASSRAGIEAFAATNTNSSGPTDVNGATVGGRYLALASVELDYLFLGNYGAAVFFDAGNAANDPWPDLKRSVGVGFRWRSPVGMVRIDVAHPLDDPDTDYRLHLSIGSDL